MGGRKPSDFHDPYLRCCCYNFVRIFFFFLSGVVEKAGYFTFPESS